MVLENLVHQRKGHDEHPRRGKSSLREGEKAAYGQIFLEEHSDKSIIVLFCSGNFSGINC